MTYITLISSQQSDLDKMDCSALDPVLLLFLKSTWVVAAPKKKKKKKL